MPGNVSIRDFAVVQSGGCQLFAQYCGSWNRGSLLGYSLTRLLLEDPEPLVLSRSLGTRSDR
jgi:hypothetical protein